MEKEEIRNLIREIIEEDEKQSLMMLKNMDAFDDMLIHVLLQELCIILKRKQDDGPCTRYLQIASLVMNSITKKIQESISQTLEELDYDLSYEMDWLTPNYRSKGADILQITFDVDNMDENVSEDWPEDISDAIKNVVEAWGGTYRWEPEDPSEPPYCVISIES